MRSTLQHRALARVEEPNILLPDVRQIAAPLGHASLDESEDASSGWGPSGAFPVTTGPAHNRCHPAGPSRSSGRASRSVAERQSVGKTPQKIGRRANIALLSKRDLGAKAICTADPDLRRPAMGEDDSFDPNVWPMDCN